MKNRISKNFHVPLISLSSVKTARSSLARGHMGGADWGYLELVRGLVGESSSIYIYIQIYKALTPPAPPAYCRTTERPGPPSYVGSSEERPCPDLGL